MTTTDEIKIPLVNHITAPPDRERVRYLTAEPDQSAIQNPKSAIKISCLILTYNEEHRIRQALTHALQWADEVVVVDKGSTDATCAIAREMGARVGGIPFSRQGHESYTDMVAWATHDWVWHFTPGEVPTADCIKRGREMIGDHVDLILVPMHYFSFGVHHPNSPWSGGWQPRLYHRGRVTFTGRAHDPIRAERVARIDPQVSGFRSQVSPCCVLHQTHADAEDFLRSHADYAIAEATGDDPERIMLRALHQAGVHDHVFRNNPQLLGQMIGWKQYWLTVALNAWGRMHPDIRAQYATRAAEMLAKEWSGSTPPA